MIKLVSFINSLRPVDTVFFIIIGVIIALAVGVYFLIPVLNKKQYKEQRDNLRKREEAFKSNLSIKPQATADESEQVTEAKQEQDNN